VPRLPTQPVGGGTECEHHRGAATNAVRRPFARVCPRYSIGRRPPSNKPLFKDHRAEPGKLPIHM